MADRAVDGTGARAGEIGEPERIVVVPDVVPTPTRVPDPPRVPAAPEPEREPAR